MGIDIGGTKVAFRTEREKTGEVTEFSVTWPDPAAGAAADLRLLGAQVAKLPPRITAVGVSVPATVDRTGRVVAWPGRPSWTGVDFGAALRSLFPGVPACFADDGDLAAIAEARAAHCADLVYFGVGTGVGGGIVLDGRPWPGLARASCELGHVVVDRSGTRCDCGRRGCVQAVASGPATLRRAARTRGAAVTAAQLRDGIAAGAPWAVSAVTESAGALAAAVVSVGELCDPALVLIGGGFAAGVPGFVPLVAEEVRRLARPGHEPAPVRPAVLGGLSSLHGAVLAARDLTRAGQSAEISSSARAASR
ncbi:ROK family protein [Amycolatopsis sp. WQ 127309]|uniref:ROK family protein n=1 Tax=Amycolatopsis sp. WQ 127309 TaxID=2932773 RepID=UPI001FF4C477|nr:ROK family protein [Amycolatopsis sp. WQ 127309]UOZ02739.1 ROK family protein [Amycolatopsis sp. WQ 127309]